MKLFSIAVLVVISFGYKPCQARTGRVVEEFKPSSVNQHGKEYSQVNSQKRGRAEIAKAEANKVQLDIGGGKYEMVKYTNGFWTGESAPLREPVIPLVDQNYSTILKARGRAISALPTGGLHSLHIGFPSLHLLGNFGIPRAGDVNADTSLKPFFNLPKCER